MDSRRWLTCDRCGLLYAMPTATPLAPPGARHCTACVDLTTRPPQAADRPSASGELPDESLDGGWLVELPDDSLAGPMRLEALKEYLVREGLPGHTRVWSVGLLDWPRLDQIPFLAELLPPPAAPAAPALAAPAPAPPAPPTPPPPPAPPSPAPPAPAPPPLGAGQPGAAVVRRRRADPPTPARGAPFPALLAEIEGRRLPGRLPPAATPPGGFSAARTHLEQARRALHQGRPAQARSQLQRTLQLVPDHPEALWMLSLVYRLEGDRGLALILAEMAGSLAPDDLAVGITLGLQRWLDGQRGQARLHWQRQAAGDPAGFAALLEAPQECLALALFPEIQAPLRELRPG